MWQTGIFWVVVLFSSSGQGLALIACISTHNSAHSYGRRSRGVRENVDMRQACRHGGRALIGLDFFFGYAG